MPSARIAHPTETVILDGTPVNYTVRRSARAKHMRITVSAHSGVVVTLPARLRRYINPEELLREKKVWLLQHLQTIAVPPVPSPLRDGSVIHYLGHPIVIRVGHGGSAPEVELEAVMHETELPLSRILNLKPGDTVMFERGPTDPVKLRCGSVEMTSGLMGHIGKHISVRVTRPLNPPRVTMAAFEALDQPAEGR